jgi:menaquinone-dependent protoporphyrinogen IX oxidase
LFSGFQSKFIEALTKHKSNFFALRSDHEDFQNEDRDYIDEKLKKIIVKLLGKIKSAEKENFILFLDNIDELTRDKI